MIIYEGKPFGNKLLNYYVKFKNIKVGQVIDYIDFIQWSDSVHLEFGKGKRIYLTSRDEKEYYERLFNYLDAKLSKDLDVK